MEDSVLVIGAIEDTIWILIRFPYKKVEPIITVKFDMCYNWEYIGNI